MDKVKSTLKQIVRDWSKQGEVERVSCYKPVIDTIVRLFPSDQWLVYIMCDKKNVISEYANVCM